MTTPVAAHTVPRAGMLATVRNRRGVVAAVEPFDGERGACTSSTWSTRTITRQPQNACCGSLNPNATCLNRPRCRMPPPASPCPRQISTRFCAPRAGRRSHLSRPRRRRAAAPRAGRKSVPRRRACRGLSACAVVEGAPHAPRQPADRRRRRTWQDRRGRVDSRRAAAPPPHPAGPGAHAGVVAPAVAGRALGQVLASLRCPGPRRDRAPAPPARHGREPLAFIQPNRRLLSLSAATGCARAVPVRLPHAGRLPASALGPADRRRVPQPDALALRRGQRTLRDAAPGGAAIRAPAVSLCHAPQRPHALVHRPAGDTRSGWASTATHYVSSI